MQRVVITGCGAVSAAGWGVGRLAAGRSRAESPRVPDGELLALPEGRSLKRLPAASRWACLAVTEALAAAGRVVDGDRAGILVGTNRSTAGPIAAFVADAQANGVRLVNPSLFPDMVMNALAGHVAIRFGLRGPTLTLSSGRLSGMQAIAGALDFLHSGQLVQAVVCGVETMAAEDGSSRYPAGEGCGALVLQPEGEAGQTPLAELVGLASVPLPGPSPADAAEACSTLIRQSRGNEPDCIVAPLREVEIPAGIAATDPWVSSGACEGVGTMFGIMAAIRELQGGASCAWVLEPAEGALHVCMLRTYA